MNPVKDSKYCTLMGGDQLTIQHLSLDLSSNLMDSSNDGLFLKVWMTLECKHPRLLATFNTKAGHFQQPLSLTFTTSEEHDSKVDFVLEVAAASSGKLREILQNSSIVCFVYGVCEPMTADEDDKNEDRSEGDSDRHDNHGHHGHHHRHGRVHGHN